MVNRLKTLVFLSLLGAALPLSATEIFAVPVPKDLVEFTCQDFADRVIDCQPYKCQAPYAQDPSIKTEWEIVKKAKDRCIIMDTTEDIGLRDDRDQPVPVTRTCEYNEEAIDDLIKHLEDIELGFFASTSSTKDDGKFNCEFTANGIALQEKDYAKSLRDESLFK